MPFIETVRTVESDVAEKALAALDEKKAMMPAQIRALKAAISQMSPMDLVVMCDDLEASLSWMQQATDIAKAERNSRVITGELKFVDDVQPEPQKGG